MEINTNSPIPLHAQLKTILENQVLQRHFKDKIPSERELIEMYSVSRNTVREAIANLVREGILEKIHGKGTFVSSKPVQEWLNMTDFTETIRKTGIKLLEHGVIPTPDNIDSVEGFGDECYFIHRLRLRENIPIAIEKHYYPLELGQKLASHDLNEVILYDALEQHIPAVFWEAEQIISCGNSTKEEAGHLGVSESMCLLINERMISDPEGNLVEYYKGYFRSDMYSIVMKMSRKSSMP